MGTQLNELNNQNLFKVPKFARPMFKKLYYKTLGTSVIKSPMFLFKGVNMPIMGYYFGSPFILH